MDRSEVPSTAYQEAEALFVQYADLVDGAWVVTPGKLQGLLNQVALWKVNAEIASGAGGAPDSEMQTRALAAMAVQAIVQSEHGTIAKGAMLEAPCPQCLRKAGMARQIIGALMRDRR